MAANPFSDPNFGKDSEGQDNPFSDPNFGKPSGALRRLGDTGLSLAKGVIGVPEAAVGIADLVTGGRAGKLAESAGVRFKDAKEILDEHYSPEQKAVNQEVQEAKGFFPTLGAMVKNPSTIVNAAVESAPSMLVGGVASRGLLAMAPKVGAIGAGAVGEGLTAAGQNAEQVRQEDPNGTLTAQQSAILAASGALTAGISRVAGGAANKLGIGDAQTMLATGKLGAVGDKAVATGANKGIVRKVGEGFAAEGVLQELPQSYQEQVGQNLAQGKPWDEGAAEAGAQGLLAGGVMGAVAGPLQGRHTPAADKQPSPGETSTVPPVKGLGFNPNAGTHTVFPDGSVILNSDQPDGEQAVFDKRHAPQAVTPSEAMGLNPAAGPMSAAAALAVDSGAHGQQVAQAAQTNPGPTPDESRANPGPIPANVNPATGEIASAFDMREADRPKAQPGDIMAADGNPFTSLVAANQAKKEAGPGHRLIRLSSKEVVVRKTGEVDGQGADVSAVPANHAGAGRTESASGMAPALGSGGATNAAVESGRAGNRPGGDAVSPASGKQDAAVAPEAAPAKAMDAPVNTPDTTPSTTPGATLEPQANQAQPISPQRQAAPQPDVAGAAAAEPASPGKLSKQAAEHLFGIPQKRAKALDRIAKGSAYFGTGQKAAEFIAKNGLKETHAVDRISATRFEIKAKDGAEAKQPDAQAPRSQPATKNAAVNELVKIKTSQGINTYVRQSDLDGDANLLRMFTAAGKSNGRIHRENLDPTGEKQAARNAQNASNPLFDTVTTKQGNSFATEAAAQRELNTRALGESHEVVPASQVSDGARGFVVRKKSAANSAQVTTEKIATAPAENATSLLGRNSQPISQGGKPFKTRKDAADAKKLQPMMMVKAVVGGYALREKTEGEVRAHAAAARRMASPQTSPAGEPIPAHAFIAAEGGLHVSTKPDMNIGGNPRIGNRNLFAGLGKGLSLEKATARLVEEGYLSEGASHNDAMALIKRSLTNPQYNADGIERIAEADTNTRFEDYLTAQEEASALGEPDPFDLAGDFTTSELEQSGYNQASADSQARIAALVKLAEAQGIDAETITADAHDNTRDGTEQDYYEAAETALKAAIAGRNQDSSQAVGSESAAQSQPASEGLTSPTKGDIVAQQARAEQAAKDEAAQKKADDAAAKKAADQKEIDARQQASAENFQLGQSAEDSLSGQSDIFSNVGDKPAAPTLSERLPNITQTERDKLASGRATIEDLQKAREAEKPAVSANTIFTEDAAAAARAILKKKLNGTLNSGIDPELLQAGITLAGYYIEKGARTFTAYAKAMLDDMGEGIRPYLKQFYMAVKFDPRATAIEGMDTARAVEEFDIKDVAATPQAAAPATLAESLYQAISQAISQGNMPKDNPALKKLVEAHDGQAATPARMKEAQEQLEAAIVRVSRDLVAKQEGPKSTFEALLRLYESQPNLNIRTSTSIANQAYSTPAPLAFLGSELADVTSKTSLYEPTAGNGMLTIGANPKNVTVNEMEPGRIESLKALDLGKVIEGDALKADVAPKSQDRVLTNPPFGSVKDAGGKPVKVKVDGYDIGQIDHLIAARALETMKDDGKAVLIIGANKVAGGLSTDDRIFFNWLYGHYNVTGHFEVNGDLYTRQGAGWPVRVISIDGRARTNTFSPVAGTIQRADNWSQVYDHYQQILDSSRRPDAGSGAAVVGAVTDQTRPGDLQRPAVTQVAGVDRPSAQTASGRPNDGLTGAPTRPLLDSAEPASKGVGNSFDEQRLNAESVEPDRLDTARDAAKPTPARPADAAGATALAPEGNQFQVPYTARSSRKDAGVLIPANMAQPTQDALSRLEDAVGDIDEFARKQLGYKSTDELHAALMGLQVDSVAMAIHQIQQGKAVVIADQTGIGKGRQAAAVIRWAALQGHTPVFVSVKPSLFTDMYGDLADIGTHDINPFIMNGDAWVAGDGGAKLFGNKPILHKGQIQRIADTGVLPAGSNALFMTYSQINVDNAQRRALMALAPNAVFVLDESHNAAGDSSTGNFMVSALEGAKGVTYLSATYAKRPDNMPLYFKTDIGDAAADADGLNAAMASGGLPLQTVVSNNLVKAGQMFRRERSYDGVSIESKFDTPHRALHEKLSNEATLALRAIVAADGMFHGIFVKNLAAQMAAEGASIKDNAGNQASAGVQHTEFSSVVHNFVKQMLLGLKAQTAADEAIASLKRGEKPIIAVENTMGSFLNEYAASNGIAQGASLGAFDYRTVLSRALARTLVLTEKKATGQEVKKPIPLSMLDAETRAAYDQAQKVIDSLKLIIPVSPIDWMRSEITKAGFSVAEITGRNLAVDYTDAQKPVLTAIDATEQKDKVNTTRLFNAGQLDALVLNVAGSTGISLHASEKFEDQRQRHMIVAQAAGDINIFMQMLGRIHRTGQVKLPKYTILSVDLPTEKRPTAVLSVKMKSLNANTSSNTESATSVKSSDILNKYGDQIVTQYLNDNYALARALGLEQEIGGEPQEDIARKATGRLALQPIETQHSFYDEVEGQYTALIDYLNKTNQNDLEPRTFDFDAQETRQEVLFDGPNKNTPFGEDAIYGEYSIKAQGHPMKPAEIRAAMEENLKGLTPFDKAADIFGELGDKYDAYAATLSDDAKESASAVKRIGKEFLASHKIGATFRVDINGESFNAVITNIRNTHKTTGNPFSLSKIQVTVAVNGALRSVSVPATQFGKIEVSQIAPQYTVEQLFKEQPPNQRETAKIVTGNLLAAYGELQGVRGTIITFTKQDGTSEQGILLPKLFDYSKNTRGDYRLPTGKDALKFLQASENKDIGRFGIMSRDGVVRVLPSGPGIKIMVPRSKLKGAKYFLDQPLLKVAGDFTSSGQSMAADVHDARSAVQALDLLMKKQALYALPSMADEAKTLTGGDAPKFSRDRAASPAAQAQATEAIEKTVRDITSKWANAPEVVVAFDLQDARIPERVRAEDLKQRSGGATGTPKGFYYQGKVWLMSSQLLTPDDTATVLFHEALGHGGLRSVFGKSLNPILQQIATLRRAEVDAKIKEYGLFGQTGMDRLTAAEEVLAEMAQTHPQIGFVKRAVAAIRTWLRENVPGFKSMALTDAEIIRSFLIPARDFVQRGKGFVSNGGLAFSRSLDDPMLGWNTFPDALRTMLGTPGYSRRNLAPIMRDVHAAGALRNQLDVINKRFGTAGAVSDQGLVTLNDTTPGYIEAVKGFAQEHGLTAVVRANRVRGGDKALKAQGFINYTAPTENIPTEGDKFRGSNRVAYFWSPEGTGVNDATPMFSRSQAATLTRNFTDRLNETFKHPGKLSWWHKTIGSMYDLAQRNEPFKRVFESAQGFINDVSYYATEAADMAPKILPKLEDFKDIGKSPISFADNRAISAPIFQGTLNWARDESGKPVLVEDLKKSAESLSAEQKAQRLLRNDKISEGVLKMWQGLPVEQFNAAISSRYESQMLKAGIVWTDAELAGQFKLNPAQIGLFHEFRNAIGRSLDNAGKAKMLSIGGKDTADRKTMVMDAPDADSAGVLLRDHLLDLAKKQPDRAQSLIATASLMMDQADTIKGLKDAGYAPLSRFGRYSVDVVVNGERQYFGLFETMRDANRMAATMKVEYGAGNVSQGTLSQKEFELFQGITPESLELFGNMLGLDGTGNEAKDQAFQQYIALTKNNNSAMKRLMHRKGITGYSEDVGRVLAAFVYSNARQTSAALNLGELGEALTDFPKSQGEAKDAAIKLADYVKNPQEEAQAIRGVLFAQYLGGSVASAFVNLTQPLAVSFPYLSQFGGARQSAAALTRAIKDMSTKGLAYEPALASALRVAEEQGVVSPQELHQLMAQARGTATLHGGDGTRAGDIRAKGQNAMTKLALGWGKLFGVAEQINRRSTFIAAYRIAVAQKMVDPAAFATKAVNETQFINNRGNKMQWGRGAIGATLMTFKSYSFNYLELLHRMATRNGPEGKKAAALMLGVLMLTAGAGGLPFEEDLEDLIDFFAQRLGYNFSSKQAKQDFLEDLFGKAGANFVDRGITGLPGSPLDVSGRMSMSNLVPGTGLLLQKRDHTRDVQELVGPMGDMVARMFQAGDQAINGDFTRAALSLAPKAVSNTAQGLDMANTGMYRDQKGYKVLDTTPLESAMKMAGFQPQTVSSIQEGNFQHQKAKDFYNLHAQDIRARWAKGIFEKDPDQIQSARNMLTAWNEKNPEQRIIANLPAILKKAREMSKTKDQRINDASPKAMRAQFRRESAQDRAALQ